MPNMLIWDDNVSADDSMGHDFIMNTASTIFHYGRGDTQESTVADDGKHFPELGCQTECLVI